MRQSRLFFIPKMQALSIDFWYSLSCCLVSYLNSMYRNLRNPKPMWWDVTPGRYEHYYFKFTGIIGGMPILTPILDRSSSASMSSLLLSFSFLFFFSSSNVFKHWVIYTKYMGTPIDHNIWMNTLCSFKPVPPFAYQLTSILRAMNLGSTRGLQCWVDSEQPVGYILSTFYHTSAGLSYRKRKSIIVLTLP